MSGLSEGEPWGEKAQSFCHQQIVLKVSGDLPPLNSSADHLVTDMWAERSSLRHGVIDKDAAGEILHCTHQSIETSIPFTHV